MKNILAFKIRRILVAVILLAILSIYQRIEEVKTIMFIISFYLILVFIYASIQAIKRTWFTKS